jgi:hypothetical protein
MAMGEAVGVNASHSALSKKSIRDIPAASIQSHLRESGAILSTP